MNNNGEWMTRSKLRREMKMMFSNFSSQLREDLVDVSLNFFNDEAICHTFGDVSCFRKKMCLIFYCSISYYVNIHNFNRFSIN